MYGWVNWTVAADTPDVVYYQSFYAYGLGWKIHVLDEGEEPDAATPSAGVLKIVTTPSKKFTTSSRRVGGRLVKNKKIIDLCRGQINGSSAQL